MKILYHHRTRAEDAQGIHIEEIQRGFRQLGHELQEVALIPRGGASTVDGSKKARPSAAARAVSKAASFLPGWGYELAEMAGNAVVGAKLLSAIRAFQPDVVYERYSLHHAAGVAAARAAGVPIVLEVNAPLAEERSAHGGLAFPRLARKVESAIWSSATAIITVSTPLADSIVAAGVPRENILVLHNAVRREFFAAERNGQKVRERWGIKPGEVVCGFTGWFRPWHGLEGFLEAFADAGLAGAGAKVMLVGEGKALPALQEIVARRGLGGSVIFTGAVGRDDIADHVAAFDVALQPLATAYASPMKIFEYLALGKPVVAAATPAIAEALTHGRDSLLFPVGDSVAMVSALKQLVNDRALRERLSEGARDTIVSRGHFWDENARRTLAHLLERAAASGQERKAVGVGSM